MKTVLILGGAAVLLYYLSGANTSSPIATLRTALLGGTRANNTPFAGSQPATSAMPADPYRTLSARRATRASAFGT